MSKAELKDRINIIVISTINTTDEMLENIMQCVESYADQEVRSVQQELERWKHLYQTEFNRNKLNQDQ